MCGLAGVLRLQERDGGGPDLLPTLSGMADRLRHRGPDDEQYWQDGAVHLAFRRLAINGLPDGRQPFVRDDGDLVLMVNGEVYNHRELAAQLPRTRRRTGSDCEVLLDLYEQRGLAFLDEVRGIFALALWDARNGRLLLARDRFGVKPLFLHADRQRLVFGSEVKAVLADPRTPRAIDWESALTDPSVTAAPVFVRDSPVSYFSDVEHVPPATIVEVAAETGRRVEHLYWTPSTITDPFTGSDDEVVGEYGRRLQSSVLENLLSEVPLGVFLSGGIDSAAVAAMAAATAVPLLITSAGPATEENGDLHHARLVASALELPLLEVQTGGDGPLATAEDWKRLLWLCETPLCAAEQYHKHALHRAARQQVPDLKVMLLGQGSDEFNGGYSATLAQGQDWLGFLGVLRQFGQGEDLLRRPGLQPWWLYADVPLLQDSPFTNRVHDDWSGFVATKYRDLVQYNCWHEDRTAAGNSIEARVPFLDHRLVELSLGLPPAQRARLLWDKTILREAVRGLVPEPVRSRAKVPFLSEEGARTSAQQVAAMLLAEDTALVREACAAPTASALLSMPGLLDTLREAAEGGRTAGVEFVLRLVNLGLLESMAASVPVLPEQHGREQVVLRAPSEPVALPDDERVLPDDVVLALAPDVLLLQSVHGDEVFVAVEGRLEYVLEPEDQGPSPWSRVLARLDGAQPLHDVLSAADAAYEQVAEELVAALDAGLIRAQPVRP